MSKKFLLKAGTYASGGGTSVRRWQAGKSGARIVESDADLATLYPEKFEVYKGDDPASAGVTGPKAEPLDAATPSPAPPTARHQARTAARPEDTNPNLPASEDEPVPAERQEVDDGLDDMTVAALKELAAEEEVDLQGVHLKAEIIDAIRNARK